MFDQLPDDIIRVIMTKYCDLEDKTTLLNTSKQFGKHRQAALDKEINRLMDLVYYTYTLDNVIKLDMMATNMLIILSSVFKNMNFFLTYTPCKYVEENKNYTNIIRIFKDVVVNHKYLRTFVRMTTNESIVTSVAMSLYH
jgi:hypothetical protein